MLATHARTADFARFMDARISDHLATATREHQAPPVVPRRAVLVLGLYLLAGGLVSFLGWALDMERFTDWEGIGIAIQPNATVAAMATGLAVLAHVVGAPLVVRILGIAIALIGATALVQHLAGIDLPAVNQALMFGREWGRDGTLSPGRMGPSGSSSWTLIGLSLVVLSARPTRLRAVVPVVALGTLGLAALSLVGYAFGVDRLYALPRFTVIAFQTATFVAAASIALLCTLPDRTPARWFLDRGAAGAITRRAVPFLVGVPFVIGWLRLAGERAGLYETTFGVAVQVFLTVTLLLVLLASLLRIIARHEAALRASERTVVSTLESITDGFVILDRDGHYRFVNPEAARLLRRDKNQLLGASAWDLFPEARDSRSFRELRRASIERIPVEFEDFNPTVQRWFSTRAFPAEHDAIAVYFRDVTEKKAADVERAANLAALSRLQALSTKLVQSGSFEPLLHEILDAAVELSGAFKGNIRLRDGESGSLRIVVHHGYAPAFLARFTGRGTRLACERAAETTERVVVEDLAAVRGDADADDLAALDAEGIRAMQSTPLMSRGGRVLGVLSTQYPTPRSLSDREQRHLDLLARMAADFIERAQAEAALKDADRRKDEFLAMLAHELRNPLAPIINGVGLLRLSSGGNPALRATTDMLDRQVGQLVRLVNDLVDVSRITRGKIELVLEPLELTAVIRQALETARPVTEAKRQRVDFQPPARALHVNADFTRLMQVIGNLLSNASKFTPDGGDITIRVHEAADGHAHIHVRDNGIGIPRDQLPGIFELFVQGDTTLERSSSGLGIGLTLVRKLVELHHGTVEARSDGPGQGSEFIVRFPLVSAAVAPPPPAPEPDLPDEVRRVLIVDDNVDVVTSLEKILVLAGQETAVAHDGREAMEVADRFRPDIVLLDIGLPGLNGYEVCRQIRQRPWGHDATLVAVTGWGAEAYRQRSADAGFDTHLVKPVDADTVMQLLRRERASHSSRHAAPAGSAQD